MPGNGKAEVRGSARRGACLLKRKKNLWHVRLSAEKAKADTGYVHTLDCLSMHASGLLFTPKSHIKTQKMGLARALFNDWVVQWVNLLFLLVIINCAVKWTTEDMYLYLAH